MNRTRVREMAGRLEHAMPFMAAACVASVTATLLSSDRYRLGAILPVAALLVTGPWSKRAMRTSTRPDHVDAAQGAVMMICDALAAGLTGGPSSPIALLLVMGAVIGACRATAMVNGLITGVSLAVLATTSLAASSTTSLSSVVRLSAFIVVVIAVVISARALASAETESRRASLLDPLTGLLNRTGLDGRFDELRQRALHANSSVCLILFDLDNFKAINDDHGHDVGDDVLREVASRVRDGLRRFDLLYRLGGDEFALLLPGVQSAAGIQRAERLRRLIADSPVRGLRVTASFGVSAASGSALQLASLYRAADQALYAAKTGGRNHTGRLAAPAAPHSDRTRRRSITSAVLPLTPESPSRGKVESFISSGGPQLGAKS